MVTESEMTVEATLSGSAAKLLLHLLRRGRVWGSMAEMMAGAGISKPSYLAAKRELLDKELDLRGFGFLPSPVKEVDHEVKYFGPAGQETLSQVKEVDPVGQGTLPHEVKESTPIWVGTTEPQPLGTFGVMGGAAHSGTVSFPRLVPAEARNFSEVSEKTARELCLEADALPEDGDPRTPTSNYRRRRDAQVKALCMAYNDMFPQKSPLQVTMAKQLLQLTRDSAEDIYDAFEDTRNNPRDIEYPASWVRKMLEARPAAEAKPKEDHSSEYLEVTPEMRAREEAAIAKMKKMGLPAYYFGGEE